MKLLLRQRVSLALVVVALAACQQAPQPTARPLQNQLTILALTPTGTATPTATVTLTPAPASPTSAPSVTPTRTVGPSPTKGATPINPSAVIPQTTPQATPLSTPTANQSSSFCTQNFGAVSDERFSARLNNAGLDRTPNGDRLFLELTSSSGPVNGQVRCVPPAAAQLLSNDSSIVSVIQIDLPLWRHDELWSSSSVTLTKVLRLDTLQHVRSVVSQSSSDSAGVLIEIGLDQALPFTVQLNGGRLNVVIADNANTVLSDDALSKSNGKPTAPKQPVVFASKGDLYRYESSRVVPITTTLAIESDVALSPDRTQIAFCRANPDGLPTQGALWTSTIDGDNETLVADVGGCAEPAWALDGGVIWFTAPWSDAAPDSYRLWQVTANGGDASAVSPLDEWSRRMPHALPDGSVLTVGHTDGGQGALLISNPLSGTDSLLGQASLGNYASVGKASVSADGTRIAVEAIRADGGADLVVLDQSGKQLDLISGQWWVRPLAWGNDNTLYYLNVICRSGQVLNYSLHSRQGSKDSQIVKGSTLGDLGSVAVVDDTMLYVRSLQSPDTERGAQPVIGGASELWLYDLSNSARTRLIAADDGITSVK